MEKSAVSADPERIFLLRVELAREQAVNHAIGSALERGEDDELVALYDALAQAMLEFEGELILGVSSPLEIE